VHVPVMYPRMPWGRLPLADGGPIWILVQDAGGRKEFPLVGRVAAIGHRSVQGPGVLFSGRQGEAAWPKGGGGGGLGLQVVPNVQMARKDTFLCGLGCEETGLGCEETGSDSWLLRAGSWGVFLKPMGEATWQKGDAFRIVPEVGRGACLGADLSCELAWAEGDNGNDGKAISWGYGDMLSRWLKLTGSPGTEDPEMIVLRLIKVRSAR